MEIFILSAAALALAAGALGAAVALVAQLRAQKTGRREIDGGAASDDELRQWVNFLNYDGTERGQSDERD